MLTVDSEIHIWQNGRMSARHRQDVIYAYDDALAEMKSAGVDTAAIHPPGSLGDAVSTYAIEAVWKRPAA